MKKRGSWPSEPDRSQRPLVGFYSYPAALPPVPFDAELRDIDGRLTGTTTESTDGLSLHAVLDGRRSGRSVQFAKMYESGDEGFDTVHYSGELSDDGNEIGGRWRIPGAWSGTFLMVRPAGAEAAEERRAGAEVEAR